MKILMITEKLIRGGKERRIIELLRYFETKDNLVINLVILKNHIDYKEVHELKNTELIVLKRKSRKDVRAYFELKKLCKEFKPDVIHSWGGMPSIYIFWIAFIQKIPFLNAMITTGKIKIFGELWIRAKITFPFSKIILANSIAGLKTFNVKQKGRVIYNGFNSDRLKKIREPREVKEQHSISTPFVVGMVSAFHERKDYQTFLSVAKELCQKRTDITFMGIGAGEELERYQKEFGGIPNILFPGKLTDVEEVINIFDIGVLMTGPGKFEEGISNAILEMMALGKPVIASKGGGTDELIPNDNFGIKVNPGSKSELKYNIENLLRNEVLRKKIGDNAKKRIAEEFSVEQMGDKTLGLYKELTINT